MLTPSATQRAVAAPLRPRYWLLWGIPLLLACLLWQQRGLVVVDIGTPADRHVVAGFYEREAGLTDTLRPYTYRWSTPEASLRFPAHPLPGVLQLRGSVPTDGTRVWLSPGGAYRVPLAASSTEAVRRYHLLWPDRTDALGWSRLHIEAAPPDERDERVEKRPLGMLAAHMVLASRLDGPPRLPPPLLLILGGLPLLLALCLSVSGLGERLSVGAGLLVGVAAVLTWGWRPWWIQPFLLPCLSGLLALTGVLWWTRRVASTAAPLRLPHVLLILVVCSGLIPLYLLLKYGLDPSFTAAEQRDIWLNLANLPIVAMLAGLVLPFVGGWGTRDREQGTGNRRARAVLIGVVVLSLLLYGLDRYTGAIGKDYATDFTALFRGVRSFVQGDALYNLEHIRANHLGDTYKYPPAFVFLMAPISGLPYTQAILAWHLFNLGLLLLAAWLLWRWSGQPVRSWSTLGLLYGILAFKPVVDTLSSGQADILMLVSLSAALLALKQGCWSIWGAVLAFPAAVKLYAGGLLLHSLVWRRWRALLAFGWTLAVLLLLSVAAFGWSVHATFLTSVLPNIGGGTAWVENQTLNGFLNRLVADQIGLLPGESGTVRLLTYAGALLLVGLTFWRARSMSPEDGFGLWIVTLLLVLPIAWMHYQAILLIPFYQLFVRLERQPAGTNVPGWRSLLLYALAWLLLCYGNQWTFFDRTMYEGLPWRLVLSYKFYGVLLLWLALWAENGELGNEHRLSSREP